MTVLVTGGDGFIGTFLVEQLLARGQRVRCLVLEGNRLGRLREWPVEICYGDICRPESLMDPVKGVEYVYHLAGVKTAWDEATYFRVNFEGTKNLLEASLKESRGIRRFIYISSQAAAGPSPDGHPITEDETCHPLTSYGRSKRVVEEHLQARSHEVPITILRPALVYGPYNIETELFSEIIKWGLILTIRHHDQYLNLIHVRDVVEAIILAAEHERACGQVYFITSQERYTWKEIFEQSCRLHDKKGLMIPIPWAAVKLTAAMVKSYRRMRGQPFSLIDDKMKELLQTHWVCSGEKAKRDLGYEPKMSLREGIEETMHRYNEITR